MCGRFNTGLSAATLAQHFNAQERVAWEPRYNLAPSQPVLTVIQSPEGKRELRRMRWGLIPAWATDPGIGLGSSTPGRDGGNHPGVRGRR